MLLQLYICKFYKMNNQLEIQVDNQLEVIIQSHNNSVLLLPKISAQFVNQICYLIVIENFNFGLGAKACKEL